MSIIVSDISYHYQNQNAIFEHISFTVADNSSVSLIGDNGTGKSTLLRLIAGILRQSDGSILCSSDPYYIPQQIGSTEKSVSEFLSVSEKLDAILAITQGEISQIHYDILSDDWDIEARCRKAFDKWGLSHIKLTDSFDSLSGGEKTKVFLAGLDIHRPKVILMDEPTNHLDYTTREIFYDYVDNAKASIIVVSHDVTLLERIGTTMELTQKGLRVYGGDFAFYTDQSEIESNALSDRIHNEEKRLKEARKMAQQVKQRQERRVSQGEKDKSQIIRILRKTVSNKGENTGAKLKGKHEKIVEQSRGKLTDLRMQQISKAELKIDVEDALLHKGKQLFSAIGVNFDYGKGGLLWKNPLDIKIFSGDRIHIMGDNGSGKTTLINLITGKLKPCSGEIFRAEFSHIYLDQEYREVDVDQTILQLAERYNVDNMPEHEVKLRLNRALFPKDVWNKSCKVLSGGERMRLYLCCLMISNQIPDMLILDEPTNNLDLSSLHILTDTIRDYRGTLLVVSHDRHFVQEIGVKDIFIVNREKG